MQGRALAIDYGSKRTGLAVSDPLGIAAHPLAAVVSEDLQETVTAILEIVREKEVKHLVVGMPFLRDGSEGAAVDKVRLFLSALRPGLPEGVTVQEWDERYTTAAAESLLREGGMKRKQMKGVVDSTAAVVLLREYLDGGFPFDPPGRT